MNTNTLVITQNGIVTVIPEHLIGSCIIKEDGNARILDIEVMASRTGRPSSDIYTWRYNPSNPLDVYICEEPIGKSIQALHISRS